jgi:hypothetical protein
MHGNAGKQVFTRIAEYMYVVLKLHHTKTQKRRLIELSTMVSEGTGPIRLVGLLNGAASLQNDSVRSILGYSQEFQFAY